jgi:hypothetical protein
VQDSCRYASLMQAIAIPLFRPAGRAPVNQCKHYYFGKRMHVCRESTCSGDMASSARVITYARYTKVPRIRSQIRRCPFFPALKIVGARRSSYHWELHRRSLLAEKYIGSVQRISSWNRLLSTRERTAEQVQYLLVLRMKRQKHHFRMVAPLLRTV